MGKVSLLSFPLPLNFPFLFSTNPRGKACDAGYKPRGKHVSLPPSRERETVYLKFLITE